MVRNDAQIVDELRDAGRQLTALADAMGEEFRIDKLADELQKALNSNDTTEAVLNAVLLAYVRQHSQHDATSVRLRRLAIAVLNDSDAGGESRLSAVNALEFLTSGCGE